MAFVMAVRICVPSAISWAIAATLVRMVAYCSAVMAARMSGSCCSESMQMPMLRRCTSAAIAAPLQMINGRCARR